ncbi:MAG: PilZ domain-containing protein [Terriglobales bacterium]
MIIELNESGLSFVSGRDWQVGEEVTLAWRMQPDRPPLQVMAAIRYVKSAHPADAKAAGVEFLKISVSERLQIVSFLSAKTKP